MKQVNFEVKVPTKSSHGNFSVFGEFSFPYYHGTLEASKFSEMLKFFLIIFLEENFFVKENIEYSRAFY